MAGRISNATRNYGRYGRFFKNRDTKPIPNIPGGKGPLAGAVARPVKPVRSSPAGKLPAPGEWGNPKLVPNRGNPGYVEGGSFVPQQTLDALKQYGENAEAVKNTPPFDQPYETAMGGIRQSYGNLVGRYKFGTDALSADYGLDENSVEITDPNSILYNPFNRMAELRKAFQTAGRATSGQMAERGQLYSGALQQRLDNQRVERAQGEDALKRDYAGGRRGLLDAWLTGTSDLTGQVSQAEADRLTRQLQNPPPEAVVPGQGPTVPLGPVVKGQAFTPEVLPRGPRGQPFKPQRVKRDPVSPRAKITKPKRGRK